MLLHRKDGETKVIRRSKQRSVRNFIENGGGKIRDEEYFLIKLEEIREMRLKVYVNS